jgi:hypothetical protein
MESDKWRDLSVKRRMRTRGIVWEGADWIHLAQDREGLRIPADTDMNFQMSNYLCFYNTLESLLNPLGRLFQYVLYD